MAIDDPGRDRQAEAGPAARRAGGTVEPFEQMWEVLRPDARAIVFDHERGPAALRPDRDTHPAVHRTMPDGVVDEDHDELPEAGGVAGHDGRLRIDLDPDAPVRRGLAHRGRAVGRDVAEVHRNVLECDGSRVGAGEQQQVLDDRGHVPDLIVDVLQRGADAGDRVIAVALQMLDAAPDDRQRRAEFVAGIGRELALPAERCPLAGQRFPDRDESPSRIDGPEPEGHDQDQEAAHEQDDLDDLEGLLLRGPVLDDLDGEDPALRDVDGLGQDADRRVGDDRGLDVAAGGGRRLDPWLVGKSGRRPLVAGSQDRIAVRIEDQGVRPGSPATEDEAVARGIVRIGVLSPDDPHPCVELRDPGVGERPGRREIERHGQADEDQQRRPGAPQDEVAPDAPDHPAVGVLGGELRCGRLGR